MKKYSILFLALFLCCGCNHKELNCSSKVEEDGAAATTEVHYSFDFFGNQHTREEKIQVVFENLEEYQYYFQNLSSLYNYSNDASLDYTFSKDDNTKTIQIYRNITIDHIDKNSLKQLEPSTKNNKRKIQKYYQSNGYQCK